MRAESKPGHGLSVIINFSLPSFKSHLIIKTRSWIVGEHQFFVTQLQESSHYQNQAMDSSRVISLSKPGHGLSVIINFGYPASRVISLSKPGHGLSVNINFSLPSFKSHLIIKTGPWIVGEHQFFVTQLQESSHYQNQAMDCR
ncbi:hypothetical protein RRG08_046139 [Elysia crispata]|uniref:Uncharacterized protein n=1 Tax=Elysia crispata TaxID=231223 RepID=A0AAE1DRH9_9GAST|nr:hypothetical protein RRG08_046139 [Elysia crispata]